ncbi:MAG: ATP-binding protein [Comamonas sp.]
MDNDRLLALSSAFSPSAPIDQQSLFAGRLHQMMDAINAIGQKGQHAILFGERGVGKTSLARVISRIRYGSNAQHLAVAAINCDPTITFSTLWKKIGREIPIAQSANGIGFTATPNLHTSTIADYLPDNITPDDIRHVFSRMGKILIVIDELDRIEDKTTTSLLADTIKTLSDHAVDTTLLLVGVADSVDTLITEHQSVERALVQIRMPRMSPVELHEIIDKGLQKANMTITKEARQKIAALSQGLPHYTHLLAQHAGQRAALNDKTEVGSSDVRTAIDNALAKAQQSIISSYHKATNSPRENLYPQVLLACAMAKPDNLGYFAAADVREPLSSIMKKTYDIPAFAQHLNAFCEQNRGPVLQRSGSARRYRFRFINPLLQPYVLMNGIRHGYIKEADIPG